MKTKSINYIFTIAILVMVSIFSLIFTNTLTASAANNLEVDCKSAVLIERNSGNILFNKESNARHPIASVTKLMTVLLTLEEIEAGKINLSDSVMVSRNANSMGGSQIFLDADTEYNLGELLKSVIVASANDSSVALAEHIAGSENNFVNLMNQKAIELGLQNTNYTNCTGLPSVDAYSSAYDQAIVLNKVLNYDIYHTYSSIWTEDFVHPNGRTTIMTNTNKLSRFYEGCIGGKTGSTNQAKYCLAVGARKNNMDLISVVLGAENSKQRFKIASDLLNYGFKNFTSKTLFDNSNLQTMQIKVKGLNRTTGIKAEKNYSIVTEKNKEINYSLNFNLPNQLLSCTENQIIGNVEIIIDGKVVETINLLATETHKEASIFDYFKEIIKEN